MGEERLSNGEMTIVIFYLSFPTLTFWQNDRKMELVFVTVCQLQTIKLMRVNYQLSDRVNAPFVTTNNGHFRYYVF